MTGDTWQVTGDTWRVTHDMWNVTHDMWNVTHDTWCGVNILSKFQLSRFNGFGVLIIGRKRITHWIYDKGVCRTAPATTGLLIINWPRPPRGRPFFVKLSRGRSANGRPFTTGCIPRGGCVAKPRLPFWRYHHRNTGAHLIISTNPTYSFISS